MKSCNASSAWKADAVLGAVELGLERIEFAVCFRIKHILYIYCKP